MKTETGGPAFPIPTILGINGSVADFDGRGGMTLRDYFAAKAMQAIIAVWQRWEDENPEHPANNLPMSHWHKRAARSAYHYADAMLAARKETSDA